MIFSDHTTNFIETDITAEHSHKDNENLATTTIPEYDIKNASDEEWVNLESELYNINWDYYINENLSMDIMAESLINNIESKVKISLRKKSNFKDKMKSDGKAFKSKNLIPREVRTLLKRKSRAYKNLKKAKVVSRCLSIKNKIINAELELKKFYDNAIKQATL